MLSAHHSSESFTPIVGVLCIDIAIELRETYGNDFSSYIETSYVKYLESAGAQVIPIWINRSRSYYEAIMNKINGILLPGGAVYFDAKDCTEEMRNDCVESSKYIFEIAKDLNLKGQYFPLWGTCMGFQLMLTHSADCTDVRQECQPMYCSMPVKFENDKVLASSKLFGLINESLKLKMSSQPFGIHFHKYCVTQKNLQDHNIHQEWKVLASNEDENGLKFITIIEHNNLPFFGVQIHPERVGYHNFSSKYKTHHCLECFDLAQYFAKFFIQQCSLSKHRFANAAELAKHFIYNFATVLLIKKEVFRQYYLFKADTDYPMEMEI